MSVGGRDPRIARPRDPRWVLVLGCAGLVVVALCGLGAIATLYAMMHSAGHRP